MTAKQEKKVINHLNELNLLIGIKDYSEEKALTIWRSFRRLECRAARIALAGIENERYINSGRFDRDREEIETILKSKFVHPENVFFNCDPRGYSLKVNADKLRNEISKYNNLLTDWGSDVTIAPEI